MVTMVTLNYNSRLVLCGVIVNIIHLPPAYSMHHKKTKKKIHLVLGLHSISYIENLVYFRSFKCLKQALKN